MNNKKTPKNYVNNKDFYDAIVEYRKKIAEAEAENKVPPRMPEFIGECIYKIATRLAMKPCFTGYSYKEEMISDAIENCILYFKYFDPGKTQNPFAYFTQVIYFSFLRRLEKEKKNRYITYKYFQETMTLAYGSNLLVDSEDNPLISSAMYDNITTFMNSFEQAESKKKEKRKQKQTGITKFFSEDDKNE
jgi:hypothetical protein